MIKVRRWKKSLLLVTIKSHSYNYIENDFAYLWYINFYFQAMSFKVLSKPKSYCNGCKWYLFKIISNSKGRLQKYNIMSMFFQFFCDSFYLIFWAIWSDSCISNILQQILLMLAWLTSIGQQRLQTIENLNILAQNFSFSSKFNYDRVFATLLVLL